MSAPCLSGVSIDLPSYAHESLSIPLGPSPKSYGVEGVSPRVHPTIPIDGYRAVDHSFLTSSCMKMSRDCCKLHEGLGGISRHDGQNKSGYRQATGGRSSETAPPALTRSLRLRPRDATSALIRAKGRLDQLVAATTWLAHYSSSAMIIRNPHGDRHRPPGAIDSR